MQTNTRQFLTTVLLLIVLGGLGLWGTGCSSSDDGGGTIAPPPPDTTAPGVVSSFLALPGNGQVSLSWVLPQAIDLAGVMVRRATGATPTLTTGVVVFNGLAVGYTDQAVSNDSTYYYSAFTYDQDGNYSVGVTKSCTPHVANTVVIPDANLEALMRSTLGIPAGDLTDLDLLQLTTLAASSQGIADLQGIQYCLNLISLTLNGNGLTDAGNTQLLGQLVNLQGLSLDQNPLTIIPNLSALTELTFLTLDETPIVSLAPLSLVPSLTELRISNCPVSDLSPLEDLTNLEKLSIRQTDITDLDSLSGLTNLTRLTIAFNDVTSLGPLSGLADLQALEVIGGQVSDLTPLSGLSSLTGLSLANNNIVALTGLGSLVQLESLTLNLNRITDLTPLAGLSHLQSLQIGWNPARVIPDLSSLTSLELFLATESDFSNLAPLVDLPALNQVDFSNNPLTTEDVQTVIPTLAGNGVAVAFTYDSELVEIMGPWTIASIVAGGVATDPADFFDWDPSVVDNRLAIYPHGKYASEDHDALGGVVYHEEGTVEVVGDAITVTVTAEDGTIVAPYVAFDGTWAKTDGNLVFSGVDGGTPFTMTWQR